MVATIFMPRACQTALSKAAASAALWAVSRSRTASPTPTSVLTASASTTPSTRPSTKMAPRLSCSGDAMAQVSAERFERFMVAFQLAEFEYT